MFAFVGDVVLKGFSFRKKYFDLTNSGVEFACGVYIVVESLVSWIWDLGFELQHILQFLLVLCMLLRCKSRKCWFS
jgi:hypothetical protein